MADNIENDFHTPFIKIKKILIALLFIANIAIIFIIWSNGSSYYISNPFIGGGIYIALGRIAGLLGEYFLLMQLVLIGRMRWLEHLFGFDKLNQIHRWTGYSILILLLSHPILLVIGNSIANGISYFAQFANYLANKEDVLIAFVGLAILVYVIFLSVIIVKRRLRYETWYFLHLLTYLAIGLALNHQFETGDLREGIYLYYWYILNFVIFGMVLAYRFLRPLVLFMKHRFVIYNVVQESHNVWSIYITGKKIDDFKFKSGQYANINILSKGIWYSHPFSFSDGYNGKYLRFTIKNSGDFTSLISGVRLGMHVIIDGPLGLFVNSIARRNKFLFIAGGIGITPLLSMSKSLVNRGVDISLLYAIRSNQDMVFKNEIDNLSNQYANFKIHYILSTPTTGFDTGYVDEEKIKKFVPDFDTREVFLCGPSAMMEAVNKSLKNIGFSDKNIHYEKFSF